MEGYLAYWDELRHRHPGMLIDSCASGGRRNDLETLRRAVPLLRSDYQSFSGDPRYALGNQCHHVRIVVLDSLLSAGGLLQRGELVYAVRSHFCPAFGFCTDVRQDKTDWDSFRRLVDDWRKLAPCYLGDYYPLTSYSLADDTWIAWQFDRPEEGQGHCTSISPPRELLYGGPLPTARSRSPPPRTRSPIWTYPERLSSKVTNLRNKVWQSQSTNNPALWPSCIGRWSEGGLDKIILAPLLKDRPVANARPYPQIAVRVMC